MPPESTIGSGCGNANPFEVRSAESLFTAFLGAIPAFTSVKEINAYYRDLRGDDFEQDAADPKPGNAIELQNL